MAASVPSGKAAGLAYHRLGRWQERPTEAPPLLLLPGLMDDSSSLRRLSRALAQARPVLVVDPLGAGGSDAPLSPSAYDWSAQVERLRALLAALALPLVDAVGLSLGGMWLQQALVAGVAVRRVVLCATAADVDQRLACVIESLQGQHEAGLPTEVLCRSLLPLLFSPVFLARPAAVPTLLALMLSRPLPEAGLRGQLRALRAHDCAGALSGVALGRQMALIHGAQDFLIPAPAQRRLERALFGGDGAGRAQVLDSGHCLWFEEPALFAAAILAGLHGSAVPS